jgi:hypothetical protein
VKVEELVEFLKRFDQEAIVQLEDWGEMYRPNLTLKVEHIFTEEKAGTNYVVFGGNGPY